MKKILLFVLIMVGLTAASANPRQLPRTRAADEGNTPSNGVLYIAETGQYLHGTFRLFYEQHGGAAIFGLPLTPIVTDGGLRVQYFEKARFEVPVGHDEQSAVMLSRVGAAAIEALDPAQRGPAFDPTEATTGTYHQLTWHNVAGSFDAFWRANGGLQIFGYPLSEAFYITQNNETIKVQYFERARFEERLEGNSTAVTLTNLGREYIDRHPHLANYTNPMPGIERVASATTRYKGAGYAKRTNIARGANMIDGVVIPAGEEFSFLDNSNFEYTDFVDGWGIIGGDLARVYAGGICQVSTTIFRTAANGGFPITRRIPHTYVVSTYEDIVGFDATVMEPTTDFRFRNDSAGPLMVVVRNEPDELRLTIELWGIPDGRTTQFEGPFISNVTRPGPPIWRYDPNMKTGTTSQLVYGRGGMHTSYRRTVRAADGTIMAEDDFVTDYARWNDYVVYGPGVVPPAGAILR
ncbi:MAG: hypothetical protein RLZZ297_785 [Chloroflexota bacterium]